jgi:multiple sugar transport system substrate-binding protein
MDKLNFPTNRNPAVGGTTNKRPFAGLIVVVILLASSSLPAQEKIALRVANWGVAEEVKLEEEIAAEFMRLHPGIEVQIESIPTEYKEKILTNIAAGEPPDVFLLDGVIIPALLNKGILLDLAPYVAGLNVKLDDYYPNVLDIFAKGESLYALPKDFTPIVMYYNQALFDQAGVNYPQNDWTWVDYLNMARQLTKDTDGDKFVDQFGATFSNYFYLWQPWVWMAGGDIFDAGGLTAIGQFDSPQTERALRFLIDLRTKHGVAPNEAALKVVDGAIGMFYSGKIAMMPSGHWQLPRLNKYLERGALKIGAAPLPRPAIRRSLFPNNGFGAITRRRLPFSLSTAFFSTR